MKMLKLLFYVILVSVLKLSTSNSLENRIINGNVANIEDHPYVVSIRWYDNHICCGAILDKRTVLTSAQCIFEIKRRPKFISIRAGSTQHASGVKVANSGTPVHPKDYMREFHENDIGIIKLAQDLHWSDTIKPISLPGKDFVLPDDTEATFVGWGVTEGSETEVSDTLRNSTVSILSYMDCTLEYGMNMIHLKTLCGKADDQEFCRGDLGGPLVVNDTLIGIASWIYGCGNSSSRYPGVYTNIAYYRTFIDKFAEK